MVKEHTHPLFMDTSLTFTVKREHATLSMEILKNGYIKLLRAMQLAVLERNIAVMEKAVRRMLLLKDLAARHAHILSTCILNGDGWLETTELMIAENQTVYVNELVAVLRNQFDNEEEVYDFDTGMSVKVLVVE